LLVIDRHAGRAGRAPVPRAPARRAGQKGSDASAREATRKLVAARRQLGALAPLLARLRLPAPADPAAAPGGVWGGADERPRNTVVRDMLWQLHAPGATPRSAPGRP